MEALYKYANHNGVEIKYVENLPPQQPGAYNDKARLIRIQEGMTTVKTRSVLAHELGHAHYRDIPTIFDLYNQRQEDRADEWAAHFLIKHEDYRLAEEKYETNTAWIAQELGVLERLIKAYKRTLHRIGDTVYVKPNLGIAKQKIRA